MNEGAELLVDLGNSRLKWALLHDHGLEVGEPIEHRDGELGDLTALKEAATGARHAWISSTALGLTESLINALPPVLATTAKRFRPDAEGLGIRSAYLRPETLGSDRFLGMAGARARVSSAFLIADGGTALTLDLVDATGLHRGGLIVPGPELMRSALHRGTAGVRADPVREIRALCDNTTDAVWSGAVQACVAVIERSHRQALARLRAPVELLLSGGAALRFAAELEIAHRTLPDLVLEGLAMWARPS